MKGLILSIWGKNYIHVLAISIIYWLFAIGMMFNLVFCGDIEMEECTVFFGEDFPKVKIFGIGLRILSISLFVTLYTYEAIVAGSKSTSHFNTLDNRLDFLIFLGSLPAFLLLFLPENKEYQESQIINFLVTLYLLALGIRSILHLRVF